MNSFVNAVKNQEARTENGMKARKSTAKATVDFFFKVGASRGKNIVPQFTAAFVEDRDVALRIAAWVRDIRGGAGERKIFRDVLVELEKRGNVVEAKALAAKAPELGRWDDLLVFNTPAMKEFAYGMIKQALDAGDGLAAKWMPRKGPQAVEMREKFGWTPKFYRKRLVELTKVVESQMCANQWDEINFNHVPSVASSRYKKAFSRHTPKYAEWTEALVRNLTAPADKKENVKINASAVFPYDVLKGKMSAYGYLNYNTAELNAILAQWEALPNYIGDAPVLALVDVSGSMTSNVGGKTRLSALDVAVSLGLYVADKNRGAFKDTFLTFSSKPELLHLQGNILDKMNQMSRSSWEMSTNLHAAFEKILQTAVKGNVPQEDMPGTLLIMSDMQFNACVAYDDSAIEMIARKYEAAGYKMPQVVFWNINAYDNVPVSSDERGVALVSGFSPSIAKSVLGADPESFTPEGIMMKTIMNDRYKVL
jgi:Domain of unknown function (DUF2828)